MEGIGNIMLCTRKDVRFFSEFCLKVEIGLGQSA